jgi:hypothetical protein
MLSPTGDLKTVDLTQNVTRYNSIHIRNPLVRWSLRHKAIAPRWLAKTSCIIENSGCIRHNLWRVDSSLRSHKILLSCWLCDRLPAYMKNCILVSVCTKLNWLLYGRIGYNVTSANGVFGVIWLSHPHRLGMVIRLDHLVLVRLRNVFVPIVSLPH